MKHETLFELFSNFRENQQAQELARTFGFKDIDQLIEIDRITGDNGDPRLDEFHDELIVLIRENPTGVDWMELECLSSYSTTTTFYMQEFCGVYWIENFELGGLDFFSSLEDAKAGFKEEYGIEWGSEESPFTQSNVDSIEPYVE